MNKKISRLGLLLALSFILSYIESLIPITLAIPGIKLGLANITILFVLLNYNLKTTLIIAIARNLLVAITFGNFSLFMYSIVGTVLSVMIMFITSKLTFNNKKILSTTGISMLGGVFHNIGQIIVAIFFVSNINLLYYLPILIVVGAITGFIIGIIVELLNNKINTSYLGGP